MGPKLIYNEFSFKSILPYIAWTLYPTNFSKAIH